MFSKHYYAHSVPANGFGISDEDFLLGAGHDYPELNVAVVAESNPVSISKKSKTGTISPRKNTTKTTTYGTRRFCEWWESSKSQFSFPQKEFPDERFNEFVRAQSGIDAFMVISHKQRAILLIEFIEGVERRDKDEITLSPKTIKGMLDGFIRHIHFLEAEDESLLAKYGDN